MRSVKLSNQSEVEGKKSKEKQVMYRGCTLKTVQGFEYKKEDLLVISCKIARDMERATVV